MKIILLRLSFLIFLFACLSDVYAQRYGHRHHSRRGRRVVVVERSLYRPARVRVYHPVWRPGFGYHRRWVFFPRYNFYWDNWRNHYVFWNGRVWLSQPTPPPVVVHVNLERERSYELQEDEDDHDDVYQANTTHQRSYPDPSMEP